MTYTLNNKLAEANAAYMICESVRAILNKELHEGRSKEELIQKLIGFYRSMSPRMAEHLVDAEGLWQFDHLASVLSSHIYIYLQADEFVDFTKVRAFLKETWPNVATESFEKPEQFGYVSIGGEKFAINPRLIAVGKTAELLLEKVRAETYSVGKLFAYYTSLVDMCQRQDITFQMEWLNWDTFRMWAEKSGYTDGLRLERKVLEDGYVISNVSWQERRFRPGRAHADQTIDIDLSKPLKVGYGDQLPPGDMKELIKDPDLKYPSNVDYTDLTRMTLSYFWASIASSGLHLSQEWKDFEVFEKWAMETGYKRFSTLKVESEQLGYVPGNVSWLELREQSGSLAQNVIYDQQSGMFLEKTGPDYSGVTSSNPLFHPSTPEELANDTIVRTPPIGKDVK